MSSLSPNFLLTRRPGKIKMPSDPIRITDSRHPMRHMLVLFLILSTWATVPSAPRTTARAGRIVLLPIDDRPAVSQFASMIAAIADHEVIMPPPELLGRFTRPGDTERIDRWLRERDYHNIDALVVAVDMLTYGGLIASRTHKLSLDQALKHLEFFRWFKQSHPKIPVYAFSVIMRVAPTADTSTRPWRDDLARWSELMDRVPRTGDPQLKAELSAIEKRLAPSVIADYRAARNRDLQVNLAMIGLLKERVVDTLVMLQDDARIYGLHRRDQEEIDARLRELDLASRVPIYNGADEGSLSLVSRAILEKFRKHIQVSTVFSSERSRKVVAPYEDHPLEFTVENQIRGAGATPAESSAADYTLYVNAPETSDREFQSFLNSMVRDLKAGLPVALADVCFPPPHLSGADERIIRRLEQEELFDRFVGYAAWNTAANTLGTAIPQANLRVLSGDLVHGDRERAARTQNAHLGFLLHRFAGDYLYHDLVRLKTNRQLRAEANTPTDEFLPDVYRRVNACIAGEMKGRLESFHGRYFKGRTYPLPGFTPPMSIKTGSIKELEIFLPWPRTFEVTIRYRLEYKRLGK